MRRLSLFLFSFLAFACATTPAAQVSNDEPADVVAPRVIQRADPEYPVHLRQQGVTGMVTIQALISKDGLIQNPRVLRSTDPRLEPYALEALRRWKFQPGTLKGQPVDLIFHIDMAFSIP